MAEELGFRTPAKEVEELRKRIAQIEGLSTGVTDAVRLSMSALAEIFSERVTRNPKDARKIKDWMLTNIKETGVSPTLTDILDKGFNRVCDAIDKKLQQKG